jgi:hypothetical protein
MPIWDGSGLGSGNPLTGDQSVTGLRQLISRAHQNGCARTGGPAAEP